MNQLGNYVIIIYLSVVAILLLILVPIWWWNNDREEGICEYYSRTNNREAYRILESIAFWPIYVIVAPILIVFYLIPKGIVYLINKIPSRKRTIINHEN